MPAKDFELPKQFYSDLSFVNISDSDGIAYFHHGGCSFLLHDFYTKPFAENLMMYLLVEDIRSWHDHIIGLEISHKYGVTVSEIAVADQQCTGSPSGLNPHRIPPLYSLFPKH